MSETPQQKAAKEFQAELDKARKAAGAGAGGEAQRRAAKEFQVELDAARGGAGGGGNGKPRNLLQNIGHAAKAPLRGGGRALSSGPVSKTLNALTVPGRAVVAGVKELDDLVVTDYERNRGGAGDGASFGDVRRNFKDHLGAGDLTTVGQDNKWAGRVIGLVGDVALDPTTYVSFGAGTAAKAGARKVGAELGDEAAAAIAKHGLPKAARKGLVNTDEVTAAIRKATAAQEGAHLAKGGVEAVVARELSALGRRGAGGLTFAGHTVIGGQTALGRATAAPFRAVGAAPGVGVARRALVPRARLADAVGQDTADRVGEAFAKSRAYADNTSAAVVDDIAKVLKATKATEAELKGVVRRALDEPGAVQVPARLVPLVDKLKAVRSATTESQLGAQVFNPAHLHDENTFLSRALTDAGRKALDTPARLVPFARPLSDAQRALRQGGSTSARELAPNADLGTVERMLTELNGPLKSRVLHRPLPYLEHNAAKLVGARADRAAGAIAQSRLVDDLAKITDAGGAPLVQFGATRTEKVVTKASAAARAELGTTEKAAARQAERAARAADELTSAQDLAVAARVPTPRPGVALPPVAVAPVMRAAGRAERAVRSAAEGFDNGVATTAERQAAAERALGGVAGVVDKAVAAGARVGERAGQRSGRDLGEAIATSQLKRARAAQLAKAESGRLSAVRSKADGLRRQVAGLEKASIVAPTPKPGFVAVRIGEREVFAHPEVAKLLEETSAAASDESIRSFLKFYDKVHNIGKGFATVPLTGLGFHSRNAQGNFWLNFLAGVKDPRVYAKATRLQRAARTPEGLARLSTADREIVRLADERGIFNRGAAEADLAKPDAMAPLRGKGAGGTVRRRLSPLSDENAVIASGRAVGSAVENNARLAHFIDVLGKTGDAERASMSVKRYLFDYADLTPFERKGMKRAVSFYTFMRKNTALQFGELARQPGKFTGLAHVTGGLNEDYKLDLPPMAAVGALTSPLQSGGAGLGNALGGLGLAGAVKGQTYGATIPDKNTEGAEGFFTIRPGEDRLDTLLTDLIPIAGKYGKVASAKKALDEGDLLRLLVGLRRRPPE